MKYRHTVYKTLIRVPGPALGCCVQVGNVVVGDVIALEPGQALIDLDRGMQGVLTIGQFSHKRISDLKDVLQVGEKIKVCGALQG